MNNPNEEHLVTDSVRIDRGNDKGKTMTDSKTSTNEKHPQSLSRT